MIRREAFTMGGISKLRVLIAVLILAAGSVVAVHVMDDRHATASAPSTPVPSFEPESIQRIDLPPNITEASTPIFTHDGGHLLFFADQQLGIVGQDGTHPSCLSCGLADLPTLSPSEQQGFATPFPDGRRVFFGAADSVAVLECGAAVGGPALGLGCMGFWARLRTH